MGGGGSPPHTPIRPTPSCLNGENNRTWYDRPAPRVALLGRGGYWTVVAWPKDHHANRASSVGPRGRPAWT